MRNLPLFVTVALGAALLAAPTAEARRGTAPSSRHRTVRAAIAATSGAASKQLRADKVAAKKLQARLAKSCSKKKRKRERTSCMAEGDWHTVGSRTPLNMPPGWQWPPSKAMAEQGDACLASLDELGITWAKAPRGDSHIATPIAVPSMTFAGVAYASIFRPPPFVMDCHLALALQAHGQELFDLGIRKVMFSSVYRNTRVRVGGHTKNVLSRHALGLALDIGRVVDADGVTKVVGTDYKKGDELLHALEDTLNTSGGFRTVLTPHNDPVSHHDHFHIEARVEYPRKPTS